MDMWKSFEKVTGEPAPQAAILYDKFHVLSHLNKAIHKIRVIQLRSYGLRDEEYLHLKVLACMLPDSQSNCLDIHPLNWDLIFFLFPLEYGSY